MELSIVLTIIGCFLLFSGCFFGIVLHVRRTISKYELKIRAEIAGLIVSPGPEQPSPLAILASSLADAAGARLANQVQASLRGLFSGQARQADSIVGDITQDVITQGSPITGALLSQFPVLGKRLRKHPELAMMAADFLQRTLSGISRNGGRDGLDALRAKTVSTPRFDL